MSTRAVGTHMRSRAALTVGWLGSLIGGFGASLTAFYADVQGQLDQVTVVTMTSSGGACVRTRAAAPITVTATSCS